MANPLSFMRHAGFDALHPGSQGLGTQTIRQFSEFGSGWQGALIEKAMGSDMTQMAYEEYKEYHHRQTARARDSVSKMMQRKAAGMYGGGIHTRGKYPAMQDHGMSASIRQQHTEFKKDFASRWDPMRKIATEIFGDSPQSFSKLRQLPEFQSALKSGMEGEKKLLGSGLTANSYLHKTKFEYSGKSYEFEFVSKKARTADEIFLSEGGIASETQAQRLREMTLGEYFPKEKVALRQLEDTENSLSPSLYGRAEDSILMEKFNIVEGFKEQPMTTREYESLNKFIDEAHSKNITHTDLHASNLVRVKTASGETEAAILDWGMTNRFENEYIVSQRTEEVIKDISKQSLGKEVSLQEYAKLADKKRIDAYYRRNPERVHHMGVNALFRNNEADIRKAANEVFKTAGGKDISIPKNVSPLEELSGSDSVTGQVGIRQRQTAIKRNTAFRANSTNAVGIGLRKSKTATNGSKSFNSTVPAF